MKHLFVFTLLALSLSACTGASTQGGQTCQGGICIHVQLTEPIRLNEPVTATITVQTEREISGLRIFFPTPDRSILVDGEPRWTVNTQSSKSITANRVIRFTEEGLHEIMVYAQDPLTGTVVKSYVTVHLTREGGKVYLSGTPIPITPGPLPTSTRGLFPTLPSPTPTLPQLITPIRPPYP